MRKFLISFIFLLASIVSLSAQVWSTDILDDGFSQCTINQSATDQDLVCTVVRKLADKPSTLGVLYVHGFNDYFFQRQLADEFVGHGYNFYAVDLRGYGRSIRQGHKPFIIRSLDDYFGDIDAALSIMRKSGVTQIVVMGHSTGGLITSYYMSKNHPADVKALVLNSPFLDWNLGKLEPFVGIIAAIGKIWPSMPISSGGGTAYDDSLLKSRHGEWTFNTDWKGSVGDKVDAGWVRAINSAQKYLSKHPYSIQCPVLVMYSSQSFTGDEWTPEANRSDAVLDVKDIKRCGEKLSRSVTLCRVPGGMHDLILSAPNVRAGVYRYVFRWLDNRVD